MQQGRYHHGDLRHALIEAALEIIDSEGTEALTIRRLAKEVGVSHAAPAHHFPDKTAIILAVAIEGFRILGRRLQSTMTIADAKKRLTELGRGYCRFAFEHPAHYRIMFGPHKAQLINHDGEFHQVASGAFDVLLKAVTPLVARPEDSAEERARRAGAASMSCWTHGHGNGMLWESNMLNHGRERVWDDFEPMVENAIHFLAENIEHFARHPMVHAVPIPPSPEFCLPSDEP
ncbi:MAG: TetR/AcrR family transcriptional regulator [Spirochaetales bacterium]|nr:TetR/AcrR family transcriptional regulator [Spirochaetales bacterium]